MDFRADVTRFSCHKIILCILDIGPECFNDERNSVPGIADSIVHGPQTKQFLSYQLVSSEPERVGKYSYDWKDNR
jgi:hypothetical protein